jgi:hypothetical protein
MVKDGFTCWTVLRISKHWCRNGKENILTKKIRNKSGIEAYESL